jgi:hypothetical protein
MVIKKKKATWEPNPGHLHHRQTRYQLSYGVKLNGSSFYETYEETVKKNGK